MSAKVVDAHNRWRSKTIGFRMSSEEAAQLDKLVALSGLTKQDYIIECLLKRSITVVGNPRVFKALKSQLAQIHQDLSQTDANAVTDELLETIRFVAKVLEKLNKEF